MVAGGKEGVEALNCDVKHWCSVLHWCQFSRGGNGSHLERVNWCTAILINQCQHHWREFARIVHENIYDKLLNKIGHVDMGRGGGALLDLFQTKGLTPLMHNRPINTSSVLVWLHLASGWLYFQLMTQQPKFTVFEAVRSKRHSRLFTIKFMSSRRKQKKRPKDIPNWWMTPSSDQALM